MFEFTLNRKKVIVNEDLKLMEYLRDYENITSVKNGCNEGACGACMVIVDKKAVRACILKVSKLVSKEVITIEGFTQREKDVFAYSFTQAGAVQCGFCIPGMVISARALFYKTLNPTDEEIKLALKGNICRCTGYVKIEEAIKLAAKIFRENLNVEKRICKGLIGENLDRVDAKKKTLGIAEYVDDMKIDSMVYGSALRSPSPRAKIISIDTKEALNHPDSIAIITAKDIPGKRYIGHIMKDWPALISEGEESRYLGDAIALVCSKNKKSLDEIKKLVKIEFEELEAISTPEDAIKKDSPKIHENGNILKKEVLIRGDAKETIKNSKYVVTNVYKTPSTEHAFLETETAIAMPYKDDGVIIYTSGQSVFDEQREISELLGLEKENVRVVSKYVGGGFGGKEDMSVQHHAALIAYLTKKPVKVSLTRQESILIHPKRHAMHMEFTTACDENGILTGMKAKIIADTGAYASLGGPVLQRACTHAAGPYNYQNSYVEGTAVYTNNPPAGAFRGFGVTQSIFATECNLNQLAEMVGISPWEIRYKNAIRPGQELPNGQIADSGTALEETLLAVKKIYEESRIAGIACAFKNSGIGVGLPDIGRCKLIILDGKVRIRTSAACIGQGMGTVNIQMVCQTTGLSPQLIEVDSPDTHLTPDSGTTTASRQTVFTGEATKKAAELLKKALNKKSLKDLEGEEFFAEYSGITDPMGSEKENPISHIAYGYATQVAILDENGKVKKIVAAHDVGKAVNPKNVEGQIEGGVVMGMGFALTEDYKIEDSIPKSKFGTLGLLRSTDVPEIETIIIEKNSSKLAYGAKGVGEITVVPTAPAIQGAYYKLDQKFRTILPMKETFYKK